MRTIFPIPLMMVLLLGLSQPLASPAVAEVLDRIVAEVNDEIITMSELEQTSKPILAQSGVKPGGKEGKEVQREILNALIDRKLAKAEAKKRGINVTDKELDQAIKEFQLRNNLTDDAALSQALSKEGLTMKELRQQIADQIIQERIFQVAVGAKASGVSDTEVRRLYEETVKDGGSGKQLHLKVVKLAYPQEATEAQKKDVQKKAEDFLTELKQGKNLGEIAAKLGVSVQDMGYLAQNDLAPELLQHLSRIKPGEIVPIQSPGGFQLIQLVDTRSGGSTRSFDEVAPEIRKALTRQAMEKRFQEWVKTLKEKAHIKIML
jgi:peptidyl-prolyl cis-trans isomerase SurA